MFSEIKILLWAPLYWRYPLVCEDIEFEDLYFLLKALYLTTWDFYDSTYSSMLFKALRNLALTGEFGIIIDPSFNSDLSNLFTVTRFDICSKVYSFCKV